MRSTMSALVLSEISLDSCFFCPLWSLNLTLISVWSVRALSMLARAAGVRPCLPIWTRGLRGWAWALRVRLVSLSSMGGVWGCWALWVSAWRWGGWGLNAAGLG